MKSALLTLIILIIIYVAINGGVLDVVDSSAFHYAAFASLIIVFVAAYFLVGFRDKESLSSNTPTRQTSEENDDDA